MKNVIDKFDSIDMNNVELRQNLNVNVDYKYQNKSVNRILEDGLGYEEETNMTINSVKGCILTLNEQIEEIENFEQNLLKLRKVMENDLYRLENSIDKEVHSEEFISYEIYRFNNKPYNGWEKTKIVARLKELKNRKVIFESGREKIYNLNSTDLFQISDVWSNRKEFNQRVKELAQKYNAEITKH